MATTPYSAPTRTPLTTNTSSKLQSMMGSSGSGSHRLRFLGAVRCATTQIDHTQIGQDLRLRAILKGDDGIDVHGLAIAIDGFDDVGVFFLHHLAADLACAGQRSEEHTSELQSLLRISYAVFCLKK